MIRLTATPPLQITPLGAPWRPVFPSGLQGFGLSAACPEGSRMVNGACQCYEGRVWLPDGSKCVSPQAPAYTGAITFAEAIAGHTPETYSQQPLTAAARNYLASQGLSVDCKISDSWDASPAGGVPPMVCSINGGPYERSAYAINLNPANVLAELGRTFTPPAQTARPGSSAATSSSAASSPASSATIPAAQPTGPQAATVQPGPASDLTPAVAGPISFLPSAVANVATAEWLPGVPNWAVLAAGAGAAAFFFSKR